MIGYIKVYFDLNRRYFKITDIVLFEDNKVKLDVLPQCYIEIIAGNLLNIAFEQTELLPQNSKLKDIDSFFDIDINILYQKLGCALGTSVANKEIPVNYISCNARAMKFLLLLIVLRLVDFKTDCKNKLKALDAINEKLSAFSSAKADSVMKAFSGYSNTVIEEYRLLALISKGGHSFKRVKNRMEILAYYINNFDNREQSSGIILVEETDE